MRETIRFLADPSHLYTQYLVTLKINSCRLLKLIPGINFDGEEGGGGVIMTVVMVERGRVGRYCIPGSQIARCYALSIFLHQNKLTQCRQWMGMATEYYS